MAVNKNRADALEMGEDLKRAEYAIAVRKYDLAIEIIQHTLGLHPENSVAFYTLGRAYYLQGKNQEALDAYRESLRLDPGNSMCHVLYGSTLGTLKQYESAAYELRIALELDASNHRAYYNYAAIMHDQKNMEDAKKFCQKALEYDPEDANYHWLLGKILAKERRIGEAEAEYLHALRIEPESARVHNDYGVLLLNQKGLPYEAFEHFKSAVMQNPDDPGIRKNFLIALKAKNRFYWPYWKCSDVLRKWSRKRRLLVVIGFCVLLLIAEINSISSPVMGFFVLIWGILLFYGATINPLFDFLIRRGWLK